MVVLVLLAVVVVAVVVVVVVVVAFIVAPLLLVVVAVVRLTQYCAGGKIEKNEIGGACGAYGGGEMCAQGSGWET